MEVTSLGAGTGSQTCGCVASMTNDYNDIEHHIPKEPAPSRVREEADSV